MILVKIQQTVQLRDTAKCDGCGVYFAVEDNGPLTGRCNQCKEPKAIPLATVTPETINLTVN